MTGTRSPMRRANEFKCAVYLQILPTWSQRTLTAHKHDKREIKSQEQLEKGTTGDEIWDALQHQLYTTGESLGEALKF